MKIVDLTKADDALIRQCAELLVEGFRVMAPDGWTTMDEALEELDECLVDDYICRVALDETGTVLGWIGGRPEYDGNVWELHPLVVRPARQRQGIGRALVLDLEAQVKARGGLTISLGTDDQNNLTTLGGVDLYPDPLAHLRQIRNLHDHPFEFYQKLGYVFIGLLPDANGYGKPDLFMAKRVA
ncbi:MAG: GNAT family N-acetyltransferase [Caldilinea sp. CFX5]|nr:GNAT family N-acetyltransferase [Caldilinea sp. CFX5]